MNKIPIIIILAFLAVIYIYTFLKQRKKRNKNQRNLDTFRLQYQHRLSNNEKKSTTNDDFKDYKYVSKFNSKEDYREVKPVNNADTQPNENQ